MSKHFQSRKFTFAVIGTACVMAVYVISLIVLLLSADVGAHVVNLANITIVFLGSVTGVMVAGQSFVDWRHNSSSQFATSDSRESRKEHIREEKNITYSEKITRPRDYDDLP